MPEATLTCDQAIFTSVRTPMGEGYQIIAASRGVRTDEKQAITRNSPSHEGLCSHAEIADGDEPGMAGATFYPLPSGRLCVALSCFAGAEHTGRGGQRVYTHNVVFDADQFPRCGFNAFTVLRSMVAAGLASPTLKPPAMLPELQLSLVDSVAAPPPSVSLHPSLHGALRRRVLAELFSDRQTIVNIDGDWLESTETLLLGLPGPLRARTSFGAGLRFSVSRAHHLGVLHDDKGHTKTRIAGQPIEYLDPTTTPDSPINDSAWIAFVDRHWEYGDIRTLAGRTSRAFGDVTADGRERIGTLYNDIDSIPNTGFGELLRKAEQRLSNQGNDIEHNIVAEFMAKVKTDLCERIRAGKWTEAKQHWSTMVELWQSSDCGGMFTQPLIHQALRVAMKDDPVSAAEAALQVARDIPTGVDQQAHQAVLDEVLSQLAARTGNMQNLDEQRLQRLYDQWRAVRPRCSVLARICERRADPAAPSHDATHRYSYP